MAQANIRTVTATEANRGFSRVLRMVASGDRVEVTAHGRVVAVVSAPSAADEAKRAERRAAVAEMKERWAKQDLIVAPWTREEVWDEFTSCHATP